MTEKEIIDAFLSQKHIAVAGFSRDPRKFGAQVFEMLKTRDYRVYAVNPAGGETPGKEPIYGSIAELPDHVKALWIGLKPELTNRLIIEAGKRGMTHVWVQQMAGNKETLKLLNESEMLAVSKRCIFMHANPAGFHSFHRWLAGLFGRLPK
ncbi:MAG: CoA-binding protein [Bacteroidales bacterium]|jgi:predicted CoA-binding protein|nr:CoA-binding protein [Bacteroidales bacterium]NLM93034.1 CoA-binding protein [Bacteroidales bacterium]